MKENDCDVLMTKAENTLHSLENCFDTMIDEKKTKMNVVGSVFSFGFSLTKLTFNVATCAVKNSPKAFVAVVAVKREIVSDIEDGYKQYKKEEKEKELTDKIRQIASKRLSR